MGTQGSILGGRYRLLDVLGDGGMARVFRAEDERLHRTVAVKTLHQQYLGQPEFVRRFEQEAQLAAGLAHPNIVAIYDLGRDDETYYIVMEYVEGSSLKALIARKGRLPLERAVVITRQLGQALDFAHAHGVVHRDIKPENILLTPADQVKVSDFGIARALTSPGQTTTGMVLGSVSYFSPEQAQGKPATGESDIYSSGVVLYEMLTGRLPFAADNPLATAMQHITQQPTPPRALVPPLPAAVDGVVLKALAKNPEGRFHSGAALADALADAAVALPAQSATAAAYGRPAVTPRLHPHAHTARTVHVPRSQQAAPPSHRRAAVLPLLLLVLLGSGAAYAATLSHHLNLGRFFAGGASAGPTATGTPSSGATKTPVGAVAPGGGATATLPPSRPTTLPSFTPATAASPTARSATPTPQPSVPANPVQPAASGGSRPVSADIVTAAAHGDADGIIYAIDPRDTFSQGAGGASAIFHIHNLPRNARVGALWTFPDGHSAPWICPTSLCPPRAFSADYTYWAEQMLAGPGHYTVSALINGHIVGSHRFTVKGRQSAPGQNPPGTAPMGPPAAQTDIFAANTGGKPPMHHGHGRGTGHRGHDKGADSGDEDAEAAIG